MPSATKEQPLAPAKKRRRDDDIDTDVHSPIYEAIFSARAIISDDDDAAFGTHSPYRTNASLAGVNNNHYDLSHSHHTGLSPPRKTAPLPTSKRIRIAGEVEDTRAHSRSSSPTNSRRQTRSPPRNLGREELQETNANSRSTPARTNSALSLSRCHICHRKPTKKSDLDSFADCQGCGQRTCFVCLRQCLDWTPRGGVMPGSAPTKDLSASFRMEDADAETEGTGDRESTQGPHHSSEKEQHQQADGWAQGGHRPVVCSRCCVEKGPDGDVVCLGCLPFSEG